MFIRYWMTRVLIQLVNTSLMLEIKLKENRNIKCMSLEYYYQNSALGHLLIPWNCITKNTCWEMAPFLMMLIRRLVRQSLELAR